MNIIYDNLDFISFLFQQVSCDLTKKKKTNPEVVALCVLRPWYRWHTKGSLSFWDLALNQLQTTEKYPFVAAKVQE